MFPGVRGVEQARPKCLGYNGHLSRRFQDVSQEGRIRCPGSIRLGMRMKRRAVKSGSSAFYNYHKMSMENITMLVRFICCVIRE